MGKRSKEEIQIVKVGTDNPHLNRLQQQALSRAKTPTNVISEEFITHVRQFEEDMKRLDNLFPRSRYVREIASGACVPIDDVIRMSWTMSDEELEQAAMDARNIHQEQLAPMDFQSTLNDKQIQSLLPMMNEYVFAEAQSVDCVKRWLRCELTEPIPVSNNRYLAFMLSKMSEEEMICSNWAQVSEKHSVFASKTTSNKPSKIITASNLTTSLSRLATTNNNRVVQTKTYIEKTIKGVKG